MQSQRSALVMIPSSVFYLDQKRYENEDEATLLKEMNESTQVRRILSTLKRGDIVLFADKPQYRNDRRFAYDGEKLVSLYYGYDDYGMQPLDFLAVREFPTDFFDDSLERGPYCLIPFDDCLRNKVEGNAEQLDDEGLYRSDVIVEGKKVSFFMCVAESLESSLDVFFSGQVLQGKNEEVLWCFSQDHEGFFEDQTKGEYNVYLYDC